MIPSRFRTCARAVFLLTLLTFALLGYHTFSRHHSLRYSRILVLMHRGNGTEYKPTPALPRFNQSEIDAVNQLLQPRHVTNISCAKLFQGDKNETEKAKLIKKDKPYKFMQPATYINATRNCDLYRLARKYVISVSDEERNFPLAYSILIHDKIEQFERILRAIYRPNNYYCLSVDQKSPPDFLAAVSSIADCFNNVFLASKQEVIVYAGFTRLQADINCMKDLRENFTDWKYVLNMAGSELPLKTNLEMVQHLLGYKGLNIVGKNTIHVNRWRWTNRYETTVTGKTGKITKVNTTNDAPPYNLNMTKGAAYAILSRAMIDYIFTDPVPQKFLEWSKYTYSPDEHYWATLNNLHDNPQLETPGGNECSERMYMWRAVLWYSPNCHGQNIRSICVFGAGDLPWIVKRPEFILNKLDLGIDYIAYQCVEELLKERNRKKSKVPWDIAEHRKFLDNYNATACRSKR